MLGSAVANAVIIGLAAISHLLVRHYLTSRKSQTRKPQSQDKNQNKAWSTEPETTTHFYRRFHSRMCNSNGFDAWHRSIPILGHVMEALADPNTHLIGVYGSDDVIKEAFLEKVYRRVQRDQMFGMVVTASITKYPDLRKIQENIASQLGLFFNYRSKDKRATELVQRIKNEQNILIVLGDLYKEFDLSKAGIPYGEDHRGCKVLVTSTTRDVLSNHMHTQKNFVV